MISLGSHRRQGLEATYGPRIRLFAARLPDLQHVSDDDNKEGYPA